MLTKNPGKGRKEGKDLVRLRGGVSVQVRGRGHCSRELLGLNSDSADVQVSCASRVYRHI